MIEYIIKDMAAVSCYLPCGLIGGGLVAFILHRINKKRIQQQKKPIRTAAVTGFVTYAVIILFITFLSRESGTGKGMDLQLFSTMKINKRNNAYVVENILLFIPYGFVSAWAILRARKFWFSTLLGFVTSLGIEYLQLVTGRGFFQIDDILTNVLGMVFGYLLFRIFAGIMR